MKKLPKTARGWRIPPTEEFTMRTLLQLSKNVGAAVQLKYSARRREFVIFTTGHQDAQQRLAQIFSTYTEQTIRL